jgi:hypothetical protein
MVKYMKKLVLLLVFLIGIPYVLSYDNVTLEYEYPSQVLVGEEVEIKITLINTAGNNVWECQVKIDKESIPDRFIEYMQFTVDEAEFTGPIRYKMRDEYGTDQISLKMRFKKGIRGGTYTIPLLFSGRVGECKDGCIPLPPQEKDIKVTVIVPKPFLTLQTNARVEAKEETVTIPFKLKNTGTGKATNIVVTTGPAEIPTEVELNSTALNPENELDGTIILDASGLSTGVYPLDINLTYSDENFNNSGKKETIDIIITREPQTETSPPTTEPPRGNMYYEEAMQQLSEGSYREAVTSFIEAEFEYLRAGDTGKALECRDNVEEIIDILSTEKEPEGTDTYSIVVGLLIGSAVSGIAMIVWLYNRGI